MVLNSLFPVFALILLGRLLKRLSLTGDAFLKTSDRLVYYIFFPALLFWKIGSAPLPTLATWTLCKAALCALFSLYVLSALFIRLAGVSRFKAGSFSQSCYRFNTYIGMAVIITALGENGVTHFGILIGMLIPIINVLAVSTLIWFSGEDITLRRRVRMTGKALILNPLILACLAGLCYSASFRTFPVFIENTLRLFSLITLPLALLSIGGSLTLRTLKGYFPLSLAAAFFKLAAFPLIGFAFLTAFGVSGTPFRTGMIFFALPTSTAIYVLSSQLDSDTDLASAAIVLSTLLSFVSLSIVLSL